ncbi:GNAT family N-acetyltransferase [Rathayibacter sp. YIM 133350]|uniref:GNAT family N-acetyltransferase n=1 Tax=Rathayibacter sp. YIM 133350 TaxID=3131992 RepID=UPI00307D82D8
MLEIRHPLPADLPGMYRICLITGDAGNDATGRHANPDLLGHIYTGAYAVRSPEFAYVVVDEHGVGGYVLAVPDTRDFEAWQEREWYPALRAQYPLSAFEGAAADTPDAALVRLLHTPERRTDSVIERWPAHLHIDLAPRLQGRGLGRELISRALDGIRSAGVKGLHLAVDPRNEGGKAFYPRVGFTRQPDAVEPGVVLFTIDL